jgi:hypothetical protein
LIKSGFDRTSPELSALPQKVLTDFDYLLPFRGHGPSRQRILVSSYGPFSRQHDKTIAFSAFIFRGITVDTRALKTTERSMCIEDSLAPHAARGRMGGRRGAGVRGCCLQVRTAR